MYNDNFLFNYMFLKSKPKKFMSSSKAASLAFQSSAFTSSPVGGFMTANNLFKAEKATKQKKEAEKLKEVAANNLEALEQSFSAAVKADSTLFIKEKLGTPNFKIILAKAANIPLGDVFADKDIAAAMEKKVEEAGGIDIITYADIIQKF